MRAGAGQKIFVKKQCGAVLDFFSKTNKRGDKNYKRGDLMFGNVRECQMVYSN